jgi:hypothetical protein
VPVSAVVTPAIDGFCAADVKPFGPVHEYVAPATAVVVRFNVAPTHNGLLLDGAGVAGIGFTVTTVVPAALMQPLTETVTEYVPVAAVVAFATDGFCKEEENPFGPVHEYVAPATAGVVKFNVLPAQIGLLLDAVGVAGMGFTVTLTVPAALVHPATVTVSEYVPDIATVADGRVGFCKEEV